MKPAGMGIGLKLAMGFFFLALLPMSVLGYIVYDSSKADILETSTTHLLTTSRIIEREITQITYDTLEKVVLLTEMPGTIRHSAALTANPYSKVDLPEMRKRLVIYAKNTAGAQVFFFLHPETGEVLASSDPTQEGKIFIKRQYFRDGRQRPTISKVSYINSEERSVLAVSAPVRDEGKLVGVAVAWINLDIFGNTLIQSDPARSSLVNRSNMFAILTCCINTPQGQTPVFTEATVKALEGLSGTGIYNDINGAPVLGSYMLLKDLDLALVIEMPVATVLQHVDKIRIKMVLVAAVLMGLLMLASFYIARRITEPLVEMSRAAEEIAAGRLGHRIEHRSNDEVGLLSDSMNHMAESLAARDTEISKAVTTLNTMVEQMPEGVVLLDTSQNILLANPIGRRILNELSGIGEGNKLVSIAGRHITDYLVSPPQIMWHEASTDKEPRKVFELAGRNIESGGSVMGMVLVIKDITEERLLAQKIQDQDRLAAVGQLASGIAHDFNNILTCVIGYSEMLLQEESLPPDIKPQLEAIYQSGERASELISQILDFSRKTVNELRALDLLPFVKEFMKFIQRILPESISIRIVAEQDKYVTNADITKLQQVLANLAVNARDAMDGSGELQFRLSKLNMTASGALPSTEMASTEWVLLEVSDTGQGIPSEVLPHIFEPFYTTKAQGKGTGLGLAQVYGIVKQHGGFIDVHSVVGKGTKFTVYLPVATAEAAVDDMHKKSLPVPRGTGQNILVVEDEQVVRDLIVRMLNTLNYSVVKAANGAEALEIFRRSSGTIDLVVTDIVMPGIDGITLSRELKLIKPSIRIIAISGYPMSMERKELEAIGIVDWVQKPLQVQTLAQSVSISLTRAL